MFLSHAYATLGFQRNCSHLEFRALVTIEGLAFSLEFDECAQEYTTLMPTIPSHFLQPLLLPLCMTWYHSCVFSTLRIFIIFFYLSKITFPQRFHFLSRHDKYLLDRTFELSRCQRMRKKFFEDIGVTSEPPLATSILLVRHYINTRIANKSKAKIPISWTSWIVKLQLTPTFRGCSSHTTFT